MSKGNAMNYVGGKQKIMIIHLDMIYYVLIKLLSDNMCIDHRVD